MDRTRSLSSVSFLECPSADLKIELLLPILTEIIAEPPRSGSRGELRKRGTVSDGLIELQPTGYLLDVTVSLQFDDDMSFFASITMDWLFNRLFSLTFMSSRRIKEIVSR